MAFTRISAAEAASMICNGDNIGLSGFTPAGTPKAVTAELAKKRPKNMKTDVLSELESSQVHRQDNLATACSRRQMLYATVLLTQQTLNSENMSMQEKLHTTTSI